MCVLVVTQNTHTQRHTQSVSIRVLTDNQLVSELGYDLPIEYTLLTIDSLI